MMTDSSLFLDYHLHYGRRNLQAPDWEVAERDIETFARNNPWFVAFSNRPWLPSYKNAKILDLGCGWGHQLLSLWYAGYHRIEGVDLCAEQVEICVAGVAGRFKVHCMGGMEFLANKTNCYDLVILNDVIEHVPIHETVLLLRAVYHALRPGGGIVLRTPNMACILAGWGRYGDVSHLTGYTELSIIQLLEQAGFDDHQFVPDNWGANVRSWRPWVPWRGLGIRHFLNSALHRIAYWLRGQGTMPTICGYNLEVFSYRPTAEYGRFPSCALPAN